MIFGFVGFRVIKTAIAAILAIVVASAIGLHNPIGAGTLAIIAVDVTRKKSVKSVSERLFASLVSLLIAWILFSLLGFHLWVLAIYILISFPISAKLNFQQGIVTSAVVVFSFYKTEQASFLVLADVVVQLICGLGAATLVNMVYMPKEDLKLKQAREDVDMLFSKIFSKMSENLQDTSMVWDGQELMKASDKIEEGITLASKALENHIMPSEDMKDEERWLLYFYMRKSQLDQINNMLQLLSEIYLALPQNLRVANLLEQLSVDVKDPMYTGKTEQLLTEFNEQLQYMELPKTREEFEVRATLFQLTREINQYLKIAKKVKQEINLVNVQFSS
ncbi:aromatic acid exporter family protein [Paenibacillus aquistagni]|uniref:aromatic acid exporter family protein n=1 Tax=Paenibacillus aquistagni TaxID=1852522 RepID=UPI00145BC2E3|nr:aromatic acid exporter family protein [Paenibacillus aquistagni]NMM54239.1 aromatic acid exporter family protein [Paenibacillus aquistagni]